ncbi:MAG TPA: nuclear transport factor 2 family protein [Burkholderiales bacterium]|nr:nuclear transport factor 2 family protein [Burkholderiales bacterium]
MKPEDLEIFADAWNQHDIETLMSYMTDDCAFYLGSGNSASGEKYEGYAAVREAFERVWKELPDVSFQNARHFLSGDRGCSEWTLVATHPNGSKIELDGCDLFTFEGDKIKVKNSYLKNRKS